MSGLAEVEVSSPSRRSLAPFLPRLTIDWAERESELGDFQVVDGSLLFVDISGFTKMSERLAQFGRLGAEEVTDAVEICFQSLLTLAYNAGGSLLKFGGDALLLLFRDEDHATRAATTAIAMQERLRHVGRLTTSAGRVVLRMSAGVHSGRFGCFLVGDRHRELMLAGPDVSTVVAMEGAASAGQIVVSDATAAAIEPRLVGVPQAPGHRLRRVAVRIPEAPAPRLAVDPGLDLRRFLDRTIVDHVARGGGAPEHRTVCIAFCHYDGTDGLMDTEGPAAVAAALHGLVAVVQEEVERSGVTFLATDVDHDGGKIILAAGVPTATEQDADALLATVRRIADQPLPLPLRIGVHRGAVFAGEVGPPYRRTYTVMGDTVNLTARLMARAAAGEIIASPEILEPSRTSFATTELEPFMVKGKRKPVVAATLGATRRAETRAALVLPLVGRGPEVARLAAAVATVRDGTGVACEIVGPAGIGKSRLVDELRSIASDLPQFSVAANPYDATTPYAMFWWLLHDLLGQPVDAPPERVAAALEDAVTTHAPELGPWMPLLATVLDVPVPSTPEVDAIDPEFLPQRVREVTATFLNAVLPTGVVVIVEDAHWIDDASTMVLDLILRSVHSRPALVCLTRRETETGARVPEGPGTVSIQLEPLGHDDAVAAVLAATEASPLRDDETQALARRAAGNPLFLETLLDEVRRGEDLASLPTTIDAVVTAQIDRLPHDLRDLVRVAAVLGQTFQLDELEQLLDGRLPDPDAPAWTELQSILVSAGAGSLRFRHALVRDAAYEELPYRRRRELHARAGDVIAAPLGEHPETEAELLSFHYLNARRYDDAWRFARIAARRATEKYANVEAAELLDRAIVAARHGAEVRAADLAAVWEQYGDVADRAGIYDRALLAYRNSRRLLGDDHLAVAGIFLKEAWIAERNGRYPEAVRAVRKGLRQLEPDSSPAVDRIRARLRVWYATIRQVQGRCREARRECEAVIDLARAVDDPRTEAEARSLLDWALVALGEAELAHHSNRALELFTELGDLAGQAKVINNLGGFAYFDGRWDDAVDLYERARVLREQTGNSVDAALGTLNISEVLIDQGRLDEATTALQEVHRVWRAADYRGGVAIAQMHLARISALRGDFDTAFDRLAEARETLTTIGADSDVIEIDLRTAECRLLAGDADRARDLAEETLRRDRSLGGVIDQAPLLRVLGLGRLAAGDVPGALDAIAASLEEARQRESSFDIARALEALARIETELGELEQAREHAAEASERLGGLGVVASAAGEPRVA
ncbi:MAG: adenylate/guanylate cyclase domain-containing protein [Acidimicrobiia bacterium]